jgi:hypothetical protein
MKNGRTWAIASGGMLVSCAYATLNFAAAADLGYDSSTGGKSILAFWGYVATGCFAGTIVAAILAFYGWRSASRH